MSSFWEVKCMGKINNGVNTQHFVDVDDSSLLSSDNYTFEKNFK